MWCHLYLFDARPTINFPTIFGALLRLHIWMKAVLAVEQMDDARISEAIRLEWSRLRNFIRKRVADQGDAEDILQDVFYELMEAYRLMKPIEQVGAWLFRVARNRITDRFRKQRTEGLQDRIAGGENSDAIRLEDLLPSAEAGPEAAYAHSVLLEELEDALSELPEEQRAVFIAHEIEGRSFKELAAESGVSVNTLLSRKRYAVLHLRQQAPGYLRRIYRKVRTEKMKPKWIARGLAFLIFVLIVIAGFGQAVLQLWNLLMPDIFGLHPISFWQAVGLMALSWILFGGLRQLPPHAAACRILAAPHFGTAASGRAREVSPGDAEPLRAGRGSGGGAEGLTARGRGPAGNEKMGIGVRRIFYWVLSHERTKSSIGCVPDPGRDADPQDGQLHLCRAEGVSRRAKALFRWRPEHQLLHREVGRGRDRRSIPATSRRRSRSITRASSRATSRT